MSRSNLHAVRPGFDRMPPLCLSTRFLPTRKFQVMHLVLKNGLRGAFSTDKNTDLQNGRERERQRETYASKPEREGTGANTTSPIWNFTVLLSLARCSPSNASEKDHGFATPLGWGCCPQPTEPANRARLLQASRASRGILEGYATACFKLKAA